VRERGGKEERRESTRAGGARVREKERERKRKRVSETYREKK